ncbi:MAG: Rdx family protein [Candidatus Eisenbacteria bacterium]|nr:Rdx family protein [Candidatus Eisenbacteria bacterium]
MAATLKKKLGLESELIDGKGGVFKVWADEELLWDKRAMGDEFPSEALIVEKLSSPRS